MQLGIDVTHRFGDLSVLEDVKFTVQTGEVVCIIGPSGCGKSTLLSIIGGLLQPTEGRILRDNDMPSDCLNPLTFIFQDFALLPWRTVTENVSYAQEHHGLSKAELSRRVSGALERTGLKEYADVYPQRLSGGMRQRVGIARALAVSPAVLLMDEPLSALDAQTRELLMQDFLDLWLRERITAVYITHNLDEALRLADRVLVLSRRPGRIKEIVAIDIPQRERGRIENRTKLSVIGDRLWSLIKEEAIIANREIEQ